MGFADDGLTIFIGFLWLAKKIKLFLHGYNHDNSSRKAVRVKQTVNYLGKGQPKKIYIA
jgi:hypothetical protein